MASIEQSNPAPRLMDAVEYEYCRAMAWIQVYAGTTWGSTNRAAEADRAVAEFEARFAPRVA